MYILFLLLSAQIKTYYLSPLTLTFIFFYAHHCFYATFNVIHRRRREGFSEFLIFLLGLGQWDHCDQETEDDTAEY